jgi:hypothetical protein
VFTGGSLIVGSAARTDLLGEDRAAELARAQYASLHRLTMLPGATAVWPTHGANRSAPRRPAPRAPPPSAPRRLTNRCWPRRMQTPSSTGCCPRSAPTRRISGGWPRSTGVASRHRRTTAAVRPERRRGPRAGRQQKRRSRPSLCPANERHSPLLWDRGARVVLGCFGTVGAAGC